VNQVQLPGEVRLCEFVLLFIYQPGAWSSRMKSAQEGQLGEFRPSSRLGFRALGPPPTPPACSRV
jgi:hypothetical protein